MARGAGAEGTSTGFAAEGDLIELAVVLDGEATLIGDVLLALHSVEHETVEVGYIFAPGHGGRGYATEAVRALLDLAFGRLEARRVTARVDARNVRLARALLERLDSALEAHLLENESFKGELTIEVDYGLSPGSGGSRRLWLRVQHDGSGLRPPRCRGGHARSARPRPVLPRLWPDGSVWAVIALVGVWVALFVVARSVPAPAAGCSCCLCWPSWCGGAR